MKGAVKQIFYLFLLFKVVNGEPYYITTVCRALSCILDYLSTLQIPLSKSSLINKPPCTVRFWKPLILAVDV